MQIKRYDTFEEWLADRDDRITGTKLKEVYAPKLAGKEDLIAALKAHNIEFKKTDTIPKLEALLTDEIRGELFRNAPKKKAFYQLIADRIALPGDPDEDPRNRGRRLENEAVEALAKETGLVFDISLVMWVHEKNEHIAFSPDGFTEDLTIAAEAKCPDNANYVKVLIENEVPDEYYEQSIQPFIVNDKLQTLYFVFYNPLIAARPFHIIKIDRAEIADEIEKYLDYELKIMGEVDYWVEQLAF